MKVGDNARTAPSWHRDHIALRAQPRAGFSGVTNLLLKFDCNVARARE